MPPAIAHAAELGLKNWFTNSGLLDRPNMASISLWAVLCRSTLAHGHSIRVGSGNARGGHELRPVCRVGDRRLVPVLATLLQGKQFGDAFIVAAIYLALLGLEGYVVTPYVMGRSLDLNGTTVLIACLFWGFLWGFIGLVLAMPFTVCMKLVFQLDPSFHRWADLMSCTWEAPSRARIRSRSVTGFDAMSSEDDTLVTPRESDAPWIGCSNTSTTREAIDEIGKVDALRS